MYSVSCKITDWTQVLKLCTSTLFKKKNNKEENNIHLCSHFIYPVSISLFFSLSHSLKYWKYLCIFFISVLMVNIISIYRLNCYETHAVRHFECLFKQWNLCLMVFQYDIITLWYCSYLSLYKYILLC